MEEWRQVRLAHEEATLREAQAKLLDALNSDHPLHGLFLAGLGRRLGAMGHELEVLSATRREQAVKTVDQARRLKVSEKFLMTAARSVEEEERRESFFDYLDRHSLDRDADDDGSSLA